MGNESASRLAKVRTNLFVVLTLFCVAVPGFASLKALAIVLVWAYTLVTDQFRAVSVLWFLSAVLNIAFCSGVGLLHRVAGPDMLSQATRFLLFFLVVGIGASIAREGSLDRKTTDRLIFSISLVAVLLKIAILLLIARGALSLESAKTLFGFETVSSDIGFGLHRLQFPSDIAVVFLLTCYYGHRNKVVDLLFLVGTTIDVILSFSRFFFVAYAVCLLIRFFRIRKIDTVSSSAVVVTLVVLSIFGESLSGRFVSQETQFSDKTRTEQVERLSDAIREHPLLGTGMGSSINSFIRSDAIPYSYEVQWYAMAMQLGFAGLLWFSINLLAPLALCLEARGGRIVFVAVFALWVAGGFTNPFIISLGSAFGLSILVLAIVKDRAIAQELASITGHDPAT